jgi:uncharacterized sporulation protein YeaH/YhbH (DUF444 family)
MAIARPGGDGTPISIPIKGVSDGKFAPDPSKHRVVNPWKGNTGSEEVRNPSNGEDGGEGRMMGKGTELSDPDL